MAGDLRGRGMDVVEDLSIVLLHMFDIVKMARPSKARFNSFEIDLWYAPTGLQS